MVIELTLIQMLIDTISSRTASFINLGFCKLVMAQPPLLFGLKVRYKAEYFSLICLLVVQWQPSRQGPYTLGPCG